MDSQIRGGPPKIIGETDLYFIWNNDYNNKVNKGFQFTSSS